MPYRKQRYPAVANVWRWPNNPLDPAGHSDFLLLMRLAWYPKFGGGGGFAVGLSTSPIVIIAFKLGTVLIDSSSPVVGGDVFKLQGVASDFYTIIATSEANRGFPNETGLGTAIKGIVWPGGVPG